MRNVLLCFLVFCMSFFFMINHCFSMSKEAHYVNRENKHRLEITKFFIEHIGMTDKPIFPILFLYDTKISTMNVIVGTLSEAKHFKKGYTIFVNKNKIDHLAKIMVSISEMNSTDSYENNDGNIGPFGTFQFVLYRKNIKVREFIFNRHVSKQLFNNISKLFLKDSEEREIIDNMLRRLGD